MCHYFQYVVLCKLGHSKFHRALYILHGACAELIASFPGLPPLFVLQFVLTIINNARKWKSSEKQGSPGRIHHMSDIKWKWGGRGPKRKFKHSRAELSIASRVSISGEVLKPSQLNDELVEDRPNRLWPQPHLRQPCVHLI